MVRLCSVLRWLMGHLAYPAFLAASSLVLVDRGFFVAALAAAQGSDSIFALIWGSGGVSPTFGLLAYVFLPL